MKALSPSAVLEIRRLKSEIDSMLAKTNLTRSDGKKVDALIAQISAIKEAGITDSDYQRALADQIGAQLSNEERRAQAAHEKIFRMYVTGAAEGTIEQEFRTNTDLLAGQQTISYTAGPQGGVTVPMQFQKAVQLGLAAVDPLLDPSVANVIQEPNFGLPPRQIPGWDLSTISATKVTESAQHTSDAVPAVDQKLINSYTYRLSLGASLEFEDDVFDSAMTRLGQAFGIGFGRGIGEDLVNGNGSTAPQGVLTGATNSGITTANSGKLVLTDFTSIFFAVNKIYRTSDKCAWLMSDSAYELARNATDNSGRPLLDLEHGDQATILGRPVYTTPSLFVSPSVGNGHIVFGDLGHYNVHVSTMFLRRRLQVPGYVEYGKALYTGLMRADAVVNDPTAGAMPPIVYATLHS